MDLKPNWLRLPGCRNGLAPFRPQEHRAPGRQSTVPKSIRSILLFTLVAALCGTMIPTRAVRALNLDRGDLAIPVLNTFVEQIRNDQAGELRGIYIPGIIAARVVQQPPEMDAFISSWENVVTQFGMASRVGSTGLLAHNYLAGKNFAMLQEGQKFFLVYGDGQTSSFRVSEILRFQALQPYSTESTFVDLQNESSLTTAELFMKVYGRPGQVVLQTCIEADGNASWGRLFVIAEPD